MSAKSIPKSICEHVFLCVFMACMLTLCALCVCVCVRAHVFRGYRLRLFSLGVSFRCRKCTFGSGGDPGTLSLPTSVQIPETLKVTQEVCASVCMCVCVCARATEAALCEHNL